MRARSCSMPTETESPELTRWIAAQADLSLMLVHDLRNPLAVVLANLGYLAEALSQADPDLQESVSEVRHAATVLERIIGNMAVTARLEPARARSPRERDPLESLSLANAVIEGADRWSGPLSTASIELAIRAGADDGNILGSPLLLRTLVDNVFGNVLQHAPRKGRAEVQVRATANRVELRVRDDGPRFRSTGEDFHRLGPLAEGGLLAARYGRGHGLYVIGLVVRELRGDIRVSATDTTGSVAFEFPSA